MNRETESFFHRKRASAEQAAALAVGRPFTIRLDRRRKFRGVILSAVPRDAVEDGGRMYVRWDITVRHATLDSVQPRSFVVRSLPR